jgi:hypothetical protein
MTAMCSVRINRSAPATAISAALSARITASNNGPRWRTRISTSPGRLPCRHQTFTVAAIRPASCTCGLRALGSSNGASQPSIGSVFSAAISGQISTTPGAASGSALCTVSTGSAENPA